MSAREEARRERQIALVKEFRELALKAGIEGMSAFMFYIDNWLGSTNIKLMDAYEERAYLHLLMAAARDPDRSLPDDDVQLAAKCDMKKWWFQPTRDEEMRIGDETAGQKIRKCFFAYEGRLYNERLLKESIRHLKLSGAGKSGGRGKRKNGTDEKPSQSDSKAIQKPTPIENETPPNGAFVGCKSKTNSPEQRGSAEGGEGTRKPPKTIAIEAPPELRKRLRHMEPQFDTGAITRLWTACRDRSGDCTVDEVCYFTELKLSQLHRNPTITSPIGILLTTVPSYFDPEELAEYRHSSGTGPPVPPIDCELCGDCGLVDNPNAPPGTTSIDRLMPCVCAAGRQFDNLASSSNSPPLKKSDLVGKELNVTLRQTG